MPAGSVDSCSCGVATPIYFPLRSNAPSLLSGAPVRSVICRRWNALEDGREVTIGNVWAGADSAMAAVNTSNDVWRR